MGDTATINAAERDGMIVVSGIGELDLYIGKEFDRALADAVAYGGPVTVDLTGADFIDSAILQSLAKYGKAAYDQGRRIRILVVPGNHPEYALRAVGFDIFMDVVTETKAPE